MIPLQSPPCTLLCGFHAVLIVFLAGWQASAQENSNTPTLTLGESVERAIRASPGLEAFYRQYLAAARLEPQATALPEPQASWTNFIEEVQTRTGPQENLFMVSQTIPWFGKLRLRGVAAGHEAEAARYRFEEARLDLVREVSLAWLDYAYLARETEITQKSRVLLAKLAPITAEQIRGGAPLTRKLTLELALGRIDSQLDDLEGRRGESSARLLAAMGEKNADGDGAPLPWPELPDAGANLDADLASLAERLVERHPRLAALDEAVAKAGAVADLARRNAIPDPTIGANIVDIGGPGETAAGVSIGFRIPIAFRKYRAERAEAAEREAAAEAARSDAELKLRAELEGAWKRFQADARTVKRYREELLPAAEQIIEVSETGYRAGSISVRDVIDDQRDALDVQKAYWRALADLYGAAIRVGTLAGNAELPFLP